MALTGMQMMLKSMMPEGMLEQIEDVGTFMKDKVSEIEKRQEEMNAKLDKICAALDV